MVVRRYLQWMENAPPPLRAEAVGPLVRAYLTAELSDADREALEAALTLLLDDPVAEVRAALSEALSRDPAAPRHLIVALIQDQPMVAAPVVSRSPLLLDAELIDIAASGPAVLQIAIARRPRVSPPVAAAIAEIGRIDAILALLENPRATLACQTFQRIADRHATEGAVRDALFARSDLPLTVRQSLIAGLSGRLGNLMSARSWLSDARAQAVARDACDKATVVLIRDAREAELPALVEHLRRSGQLTTSLLVRAICAGHIRFFEASVSMLAAVPAQRAFAILAEGREAALRALFEKAGLPRRSHPAFIAALDVWRELEYDAEPGDQSRFSRRMIERILTRYQDFQQGDLDDLLSMLRRLAAEAARDAARDYMQNMAAEAA